MESCGTDLLCGFLSQIVDDFTLTELNTFKAIVGLIFACGFYYLGTRQKQAVYKEAFINGIQFKLVAEANKKAGIEDIQMEHFEHFINEAKLRNAKVKRLVQADVFEDFFKKGAHLLHQGYKDEAAIIIGCVLENHVKQLCKRYELSIENEKGRPIKLDTLNASLAKKEIYSRLDQKSITAWAGLRNHAAHGQYNEYTAEQVSLMLDGVRNFTLRLSD